MGLPLARMDGLLQKQLPWSWLFYGLVVYIAWPMLWSAPLVDEPVMVYTGWQVAQGKLLYRDVFEFVMPGTALLTAGVMKLVSGGYPGVAFWVVIRGVNVLLWLLSMAVMEGCLTHCQVNTLGRWFYRLWMTSFLLADPRALLQLNHHLYSSHLCVWALGAVFQSIRGTATEKQREQWLVLAGLLVGLAICFTQSLGVIMSVCLGLCIWHRSRAGEIALRSVLYYAIAVLMPALLVCGYFDVVGAFASFWDCVVMYPLTSEYREVNSFPYQPLFYDVPFVPEFMKKGLAFYPVFAWPFLILPWIYNCLIVAVILSGFILSIVEVLKAYSGKIKETQLIIVTLSWAVIGYFLATLSSPSGYLFCFHAWTAPILVLMFSQKKLNRWLQFSWVLVGMAALVFVGLLKPGLEATGTYGMQIHSPGQTQSLFTFTPTGRLGTGTLNRLTAWMIRENEEKLKKRKLNSPTLTVFAFNGSPLLYILLNADNPTPYPYLMPLLNTPAHMTRALNALKVKPPQWIIWDRWRLAVLKDSRYQKFPPERLEMPTEFKQWVLGHYKRVFEAYPYVVYERRGD